MRHYVLVVDHSVQCIHSRANVLGHCRISHARTAVVMNHGLHSKLRFEPKPSDLRQSSSQAVPRCENGGSRMLAQQICDGLVDFVLDDAIVSEKSCVYLAAFAVVRSFFDVKVFYPILNVCRSSEGYNDSIFCLFVTNEARGKSQWVIDVGDFCKIGEVLCRLAGPCVEALLGTVGEASIQSIFFRFCFIVVVSVRQSERAASQDQQQKEDGQQMIFHKQYVDLSCLHSGIIG